MAVAPALAAAALLLVAAEPSPPAGDPCRAASAPLARAADAARDVSRAVEAYRAGWRRACAGEGTLDVAALFGDAEALSEDVRMARSVRAIAAAAGKAGGDWPLPAMAAVEGDLAVDWAAFGWLGARGNVDDARFWRGATVAADGLGGPAWLAAIPGAPGECVRLGETPWLELGRALEDMEAAEAPQYAGHARALRERLMETLGELARGAEICGCLRGDAAAGLAALGTPEPGERAGTPARRALVKAGGEAVAALRAGRAKVRWLRDAAGGPATGCGTP